MKVQSLSVQYGCGSNAPDGWLNFDSSPALLFERLPVIGFLYAKNATRFPNNVRYGDIVRGLPLAPQCAERLYASHVLEHLAYQDALKAIDNSYAILKPGGVFRLIVPDLDTRARRYVERANLAEVGAADEFMDSTFLGERTRPKGIMSIASAIFGSSPHRWMWDERSMAKALAQAGFCAIRRCQIGDSKDPMFTLVEHPNRFVDGDIVELAMDCRKPG